MSARSNTTIELNGKKYDTKTGKIVSDAKSSTGATAPRPNPGVIDGFTRKRVPRPRPKNESTAIHKKTEKSKTLMRKSVKKPQSLSTVATEAPVIRKRNALSPVGMNPRRVSRAKNIKQSNLVSKFGTRSSAIKPVAAPLSVKPAPESPPAPILERSGKNKARASKPSRKSEAILQAALESADSHKQPRRKSQSRRSRLSKKLRVSNKTLNLAAASLALVLLAGFVAYQNVPNLSMQIATARAGVNGNLPGYQPSGFGLAGPINYQAGKISINYASRSDDRRFQISQTSTQWNSETLLENFIAAGKKTYQTFQDGGKTIYIYDGNNATWVDGGVWYQIEGNSALNSDQLLRMAASM